MKGSKLQLENTFCVIIDQFDNIFISLDTSVLIIFQIAFEQ